MSCRSSPRAATTTCTDWSSTSTMSSSATPSSRSPSTPCRARSFAWRSTARRGLVRCLLRTLFHQIWATPLSELGREPDIALIESEREMAAAARQQLNDAAAERRSISESGGDSGASDSGVGSHVSQASLPTTTPPASPGYLLHPTTTTGASTLFTNYLCVNFESFVSGRGARHQHTGQQIGRFRLRFSAGDRHPDLLRQTIDNPLLQRGSVCSTGAVEPISKSTTPPSKIKNATAHLAQLRAAAQSDQRYHLINTASTSSAGRFQLWTAMNQSEPVDYIRTFKAGHFDTNGQWVNQTVQGLSCWLFSK